MYDGINKATMGMLAMNMKQDVILNNLANVGTSGYRKENFLIFQRYYGKRNESGKTKKSNVKEQ